MSTATATQLHGRPLVAWLKDNGLDCPRQQLNPTLERALSRWRSGGKADVYVVDEVLVCIDVHLSELPDELWIEPKQTKTVAPDRGGTPPGLYGRLNDSALRVLHRLHSERGLPVKELARRVYGRAGFASAGSAESAIREGFKRLDLPVRRQPPPEHRRCEGIKSTYPNKGRRCIEPTMVGSQFCFAHDPARRAEVVRLAAEARARIGAAV